DVPIEVNRGQQTGAESKHRRRGRTHLSEHRAAGHAVIGYLHDNGAGRRAFRNLYIDLLRTYIRYRRRLAIDSYRDVIDGKRKIVSLKIAGAPRPRGGREAVAEDRHPGALHDSALITGGVHYAFLRVHRRDGLHLVRE